MFDVSFEDLETENDQYLAAFDAALSQEKTTDKTKNKHYSNAHLFVVDFLTHKIGAAVPEGTEWLDEFFLEFFTIKCMWSTEATMKEMITSIRKFYKAMHQTEKIDKSTLDAILKILKEEKANWIQTVNEFNHSDVFFYIDPSDLDDDSNFGYDEDEMDALVMENYYDSLHTVFKCLKEIIILKPWEWLENDRLLSVSQPSFYMHYFISSMGNQGNDRGLVIREGYDGLTGHFDAYTKDVMTSHDFQTKLNGYSIHFTEKKFLNPTDLALLEDAKVNFSPNRLMPKIMRHKLGRLPDQIDPADMDALEDTLEMFLTLIKRKDLLAQKLKNLPFDKIYGYFGMNLLDERPVETVMKDTFSFPYPLISFNENDAKEIKKTCKSTDTVIEVEEFYHNALVLDEDEEEVIPLVFTIIDHKSGYVSFGIELLEDGDKYFQMNAMFLDWLRKDKQLPKVMRFTSRKMLTAFHSIAEMLNIDIVYCANNPMSDDFRVDFLEHARTQG